MRAKTILVGALALGLCACTNDDTLTEGNDKLATVTDGVYMKFNISLPTSGGTRSATDEESDDYVVSTGGVEVGLDEENAINSLLVVLTNTDNEYVASVEASIGDPELTKVGEQTYVLAFDGDALTQYEGDDMNVYVYCNPVSSLSTTSFDADGTYTISDPENDEVWQSNTMLMSNAKPAEATISDLASHTTIDNPLDLGTVYVERSVARFDYKDGSENSDFTYEVGDLYNADGNTDVTVTLTRVAVVNMSNSFYYLRRTAADASALSENGTVIADYTTTKLLGTETNNNWIIDTDAASKMDWTSSTDLSANFKYYLGSAMEWTSLSSLSKEDNSDNWTDETENDIDKEGYYIWRYVTENTIPSVDDQKQGISTGVVFEGTINVTGVAEGTTLYAFGTTLYAGWDEVAAAVAAGDETSSLAVAYAKVVEQMDDDEEAPTAAELAAADAGFTAYTANADGNYYVYYYYWNRHNDNGDSEIMSRMEFAVVRNNVYKLSVTAINQFGYPEDETPDPDEPDETTEYYFQVNVEILPWVVRLNNIEF